MLRNNIAAIHCATAKSKSATTIVDTLQAESGQAESVRRERISGAQQRLSALRSRMDQMYEDKLDGKINEDFWTRKTNEWREQERSLESQLAALSSPLKADNVRSVKRIFELANKAYSLPYEEYGRTRSIAEIGTFELRDGWRKSLPYL
jgi:small-conductance mechanosensitive channel